MVFLSFTTYNRSLLINRAVVLAICFCNYVLCGLHSFQIVMQKGQLEILLVAYLIPSENKNR